MFGRVASLFRFSSQLSQVNNQTGAEAYRFAKDIPTSVPREHMNLFQAINSAIDIALATDKT